MGESSAELKPQMNADERGLGHPVAPMDQLTEQVIGCAMRVSSALGAGFLEKVYENALAHELRKSGIAFQQQRSIPVRYDKVVVGDYVVNLLVDHRLLIELKACRAIDDIHMAQTLNYLRATELNVALILNFGKPKLQIKRVVDRY